jgi:hypothetical protein
MDHHSPSEDLSNCDISITHYESTSYEFGVASSGIIFIKGILLCNIM